MNLFPFLQPAVIETEEELPLCQEVKWDFERDCPVFLNGSPVVVTGQEAVKVWVWNALHTERRRYVVFTWNYGNDIEELIGKPYSDTVKQMECQRYIKDCLMIHPYILDVTEIDVSFSVVKLNISCVVKTVYGDFKIGSDGIG